MMAHLLPIAAFFASLLAKVLARCPPNQGVIYLMHGGYCLPEYTVISDIALTADNPLHCVLAGSSGTGGGGGQWTGGPENKPLECGEPGSGPFTCSQSSDPTNITLYKKKGALFSESQKYTCTISSQSISVQIKSSRILSAIYIEPPTDVRSVPQNYTIHCITTGQNDTNITVQLYLEKHSTRNKDSSSYHANLTSFLTLNATTQTLDYSEVRVWYADRTVVDATRFSGHGGLTEYNGDHDWTCEVVKNKDLSTYIRAPNSSSSDVIVCQINSTSYITICWTPVDPSEADGYVVYYETSVEQAIAVDVGDITHYTLVGLKHGIVYTVTVRAYQALLGEQSPSLTIQLENSSVAINGFIVVGIVNLTLTNLTRLSGKQQTQYRIECVTRNISSEHIHWMKNGQVVANSTTHHQISMKGDNEYQNYLTVTTMERDNTVISCTSQQYTKSIVIKAPSGPPVGVVASINSLSSIAVSWSPPVGGADGYVILYSTEGSSNMTQLVEGEDQTSSLLTGLSEGQLYTIRVFAYKDLYSQPSQSVNVAIVPAPDPLLAGFVVGGTSVTLVVTSSSNKTANTSTIGVVGYTLALSSSSCSQLQIALTNSGYISSLNDTLQVTRLLHPGLLYNITVSLGNSSYSIVDYESSPSAPNLAPEIIMVAVINSTAITATWREVPCSQSNGKITQHQIKYTCASTTGLTSVLGNETQHIITGLEPFTQYDISVGAMNTFGLGPFSYPVTRKTLYNAYLIKPLKWTLLSDRASLTVQYQVNCITERIVPTWFKNGLVVVNSLTHDVSHHHVNSSTINNTLTVSGMEHDTQIITCAVTHWIGPETSTLTAMVMIEAPTEVPKDVRSEILSQSSIYVNWSAPMDKVNGFVIHYNDDNGMSMIQEVEDGDLLHSTLSNLNKGHNYTITVSSYIDLPSLPSDPIRIKLDVPNQVAVEDVLLATNNVLTLVLNSDSSATQYTISYHSTTCQEVGTTVVTIPASQTHYSMTVFSGQAYNITVTAHNQIGTSKPEKMVYIVPVYEAPDGLPANVSLAVINSTAVHVTWSYVSCVSSNGAIVSYLVVYTGAVGGGKTLTVPSTESSTVITNLNPQSQYSVRVAVRNEKGNGPFSDPLYTSTPTGPVQLLTCAVNNQTSVTLVWSTARYSFNQSMFQVTYMPIPNCNLSLAAMDARKVATVSQNFAVIGSLNPQTCYVFGVRMISGNAVNEDRSIQCTTSQEPTTQAISVLAGLFGAGLVISIGVLLIIVVIIIKHTLRRRSGYNMHMHLSLGRAPAKLTRTTVMEMKENSIYESFTRGNAIYDSIRRGTNVPSTDNKVTDTPIPHVYDLVQHDKANNQEITDK